MNHLGDIIYQLRRAAGLSAEELAVKADVSHSFVSKLEAKGGKPSIRTLSKLAKVLSISLSDLIAQSEVKGRKK